MSTWQQTIKIENKKQNSESKKAGENLSTKGGGEKEC